MAIQHNVTGTAVIAWDSNDLGYSEDGCQIQVQPKYAECFSDQFGGRGGAPSDVQILGAIVLIRCLMTAYEQAEERKYLTFDPAFTNNANNAAGNIILPDYGTFLRQDGVMKALTITGNYETWTFDKTFIRDTIDLSPVGTVMKKLSMGFEGHVDAATTREILTVIDTPP